MESNLVSKRAEEIPAEQNNNQNNQIHIDENLENQENQSDRNLNKEQPVENQEDLIANAN
jgi:hypothetical protein